MTKDTAVTRGAMDDDLIRRGDVRAVMEVVARQVLADVGIDLRNFGTVLDTIPASPTSHAELRRIVEGERDQSLGFNDECVAVCDRILAALDKVAT